MVAILTFVEMLTTILFAKIYLNKSVDEKKYMDICISIFITGLFILLTKIVRLDTYYALLVIGIILIYLESKFTKIHIVDTTVSIIISMISVFFLEIVINLILYYILRFNYIEMKVTMVLMIIVNLLSLVILSKILKGRKINMVETILQKKEYSLVLINGLILLLLFKLLIENDLLRFELVIHFFIIFIFLIGANIVYFIYDYKKQKESKKLEIKDNINPLIDELLENMRASEHEYKNHLNILYCMMQVCDTEELRGRARNYIGNVMEQNKFLSELTEVKNTIIKALLFSKMHECEKKGVYCDFDIESDLQNIKLDDSELTVILSNLINNSIEAAKDSIEKEIYIYIGEKKDKYFIKVSNSCKDLANIDVNNILTRGYSTKGINRGYGLYNINEIVSKYKGDLCIYKSENMLHIEIVI